MEGPGSIPGRGVTLLPLKVVNKVKNNNFPFDTCIYQEAARVAQSVER